MATRDDLLTKLGELSSRIRYYQGAIAELEKKQEAIKVVLEEFPEPKSRVIDAELAADMSRRLKASLLESEKRLNGSMPEMISHFLRARAGTFYTSAEIAQYMAPMTGREEVDRDFRVSVHVACDRLAKRDSSLVREGAKDGVAAFGFVPLIHLYEINQTAWPGVSLRRIRADINSTTRQPES